MKVNASSVLLSSVLLPSVLLLLALPVFSQTASERLGTVSFSVSCSASTQVAFNRGVALLHDFWYEEAANQFAAIERTDPGCAMAQWGETMSGFHEIWERPDAATMKSGWAAMQKAGATPAKTAREQAYIDALGDFYRPTKLEFQARIDAYSAAMGALYKSYPDDPDAAAFYALSLLASQRPDDASVEQEQKAMAVLEPAFVRFPDNPGVVHYIIHACDTPSLAPEGLKAAQHYGEIAQSGAHAVHMPGHIFARLGMWQADIDSQLASVAASKQAVAGRKGGGFDQLHSDDFLIYAYLQSGQELQAHETLEATSVLLTHFDAMPEMAAGMGMMLPMYKNKLPVFYWLEMRDWAAAEALQPVKDSPAETQTSIYWAHAIAAGHLHEPAKARAALASWDDLLVKIKKGDMAYMLEGSGVKIERSEMLAWVAFAGDKQQEALQDMRDAAELQDKAGQGEVDIPAREMLADMLLAFHKPQEALVEYDRSLKLSPNRFNGLFNAGMAAEAEGDRAKAAVYYNALMKSTNDGTQSKRPEFAHVKTFRSTTQMALR